jgi:DNA-directed RNA polymerase subunit RPC12/RpoP
MINVTSEIQFNNNDDEALPITKCICGAQFDGWEFYISIYEDCPTPCPKCGRRFIFKNQITVYEVAP